MIGYIISTGDFINDGRGLLPMAVYGNGNTVNYTYDAFDGLINECYDNSNRYTYEYGANGQVAVITDAGAARKSVIEYDLAGRPLQRTISRTYNGELLYRTVLKYINN